MSAQTSSIQPRTFAQPVAFYNVASTAARCVCESAIRLHSDEDWKHYDGDTWCAPVRDGQR